MANFFKKAGKALGKASKFISSNPILSTALSAVPVVGGIASKAAQFGAMLDSRVSLFLRLRLLLFKPLVRWLLPLLQGLWETKSLTIQV